MTEQGFCGKCGNSYLSANHAINCNVLGNVCINGALARSCQICELLAERDRLTSELEQVKTHHRYDLDQFRKCHDLLAKERDESGAKQTALLARIGELEQGKVSHQGDKILCPDCESPCELKRRLGGEHYLAHPIYACPKSIQAELTQEQARLSSLSNLAHRMAEAIQRFMDNDPPHEGLGDTLAAFRAAEGEGKGRGE